MPSSLSLTSLEDISDDLLFINVETIEVTILPELLLQMSNELKQQCVLRCTDY